METCGVEHPRVPDLKCSLPPHKGEWHKMVYDSGAIHEYRVKPPKPLGNPDELILPPCERGED